MTDLPTVVVVPAGALLAILATVAGLVRSRRRAKPADRGTSALVESARQGTSALVESARASTLLAARVDALEKSDSARRQLDQSIERLSTVISRAERVLGSAADQTEHVVQSSERLDRTLDEAQQLVRELRTTAERANDLVDQLGQVVESTRERPTPTPRSRTSRGVAPGRLRGVPRDDD